VIINMFLSSEPDLEQCFELSDDFLCITDEKGCLKQVNQAFEAQLGYDREGLLSSPLVNLIYPDDQPAHQQQMNRLQAVPRALSFRSRVLSAKGQCLWLDWKVTPVGHDQDYPLLFWIGRHITSRQQSEAELYSLNQQLGEQVFQGTTHLDQAFHRAQLYISAIQNMPLGLYIWQMEQVEDLRGFRLIAANPVTSQLTGIPIDEVLNRSMAESFPELLDSGIAEAYWQVLHTGKAQDLGEVMAQHPQAAGDVFSVKVFPLPNHCVGVAFENITERKRQKVLLEDQKEQLRILFDEIAVGIARLDLKGHWIQVNQSLADMLGYTQAELYQLAYQDITVPDDLEVDRIYHQQFLAGTIHQANFEKRYFHKDGHTIWANVTISVVQDSQQAPLYFIAVIENITQRKQAELSLKAQRDELTTMNLVLTQTMRNLERRNEELNQFAYVASHDLKAPLRAIGNLASWMEEDLAGKLPAENQHQLQLMQGRVHRMEGLIDGLLEYSRVGRFNQKLEKVPVGALLVDVIRTLEPPPGFTVLVDPDMPTLMTQRMPLRQVFSNLIGNAIRHHDRPQGQIHISVKALPRCYEFSVTDDGPGIDPKYHRKIFSIFQTLKPRDTFESTGIGLSIVKKILDAEGGEIRVNSTEGQGATFTFTWPVNAEFLPQESAN
jgi:PAS domain S-box-containing protein